MLRSLNSGVSGMKANQVKMDVIGNNIANVNTTAFKSQRVTFKDILSQTLENASAPAGGKGGTNPKQAGLGVAVAGIDTDMRQGALSTTGRATDIAIEGNGFFVISDGIEYRFTRDGSFTLDSQGNLVTSEGFHVMGIYNTAFLADAYDPNNPPTVNVDEPTFEPEISQESSPNITELKNIVIPFEALDESGAKQKLLSFSIDKDGTIKGIYGDKTVVIGKIVLANFQNPAGLEKLGGNTYRNTSNSGSPSLGIPASSGYGTVRQGLLEMSNVDLAEQFTEMIVTSRAFQANSRTITTSDEMLQELLNLKR
ncbi:flagellar hook protein FlgE [Caloramator fervidus]|uniref:Flagellar hook protein FlgE n=1 Tax=Caloramator fervidus TaxID=29344 RepID=A0A1H5SDX1_9CLOT|nr:flagellar hook-basal body complex protein [Caloramator fervidus]SEF48168.1 flagellar hook protein FlgE [Caloramator fervidus]